MCDSGVGIGMGVCSPSPSPSFSPSPSPSPSFSPSPSPWPLTLTLTLTPGPHPRAGAQASPAPRVVAVRVGARAARLDTARLLPLDGVALLPAHRQALPAAAHLRRLGRLQQRGGRTGRARAHRRPDRSRAAGMLHTRATHATCMLHAQQGSHRIPSAASAAPRPTPPSPVASGIHNRSRPKDAHV